MQIAPFEIIPLMVANQNQNQINTSKLPTRNKSNELLNSKIPVSQHTFTFKAKTKMTKGIANNMFDKLAKLIKKYMLTIMLAIATLVGAEVSDAFSSENNELPKTEETSPINTRNIILLVGSILTTASMFKKNPNKQDENGDTELIRAVRDQDNKKVIKQLANEEVDPNIKNNDDESALSIAIDQRNITITEAILRNKKTNPNITCRGEAVIFRTLFGAQNGYNQYCSEIWGNRHAFDAILASEKTNPNIKNSIGIPLLIEIINRGCNIVYLRKLCENRKTDLNITDPYGNTGVELAKRDGYFDYVELIEAYRSFSRFVPNNTYTYE